MKNSFDIIKFIFSEKKYARIFSDEHYQRQVDQLKKYFPDLTIEILKERDKKEYVNYLEADIPMGCSRIGGPIVDLPDEIKYPDGYYFLAQINCSDIKQFDKIGFLPENGFLYFFLRDDLEHGCVYYTDKSIARLKRVIKEHENCNWYGKIIKGYSPEIEKIESRYTEADSDGEKEWDYFAGSEISKIYGIYSNCQANEEDVIKFIKDEDKIILLQIGGDYMDEGCQNVIIKKNDLINKDFSKCTFEYNQS